MTIVEAIDRIDALKPNGYSISEKVSWLSILDGLVYRQIISTHLYNDDETEVTFEGYSTDNLDQELLIYAPYDEECYLSWLESKIDSANGEYTKYNNAVMKFTDSFVDFRNDYNAHHMPKGQRIRYF